MINAKYSSGKRLASGVLQGLIYGFGVLIALLALAQKDADPKLLALAWAATMYAWARDNGWWVIPTLTAGVAIAKLLRDSIERSWLWYLVQEIVDQVRLKAFRPFTDPQHYHRATLFRRQWCWWPTPVRSMFWPWGRGRCPWSGWLVPIVRSGHTTQKSRTVFLAPDDADNIEGMVGAIWSKGIELSQGFRKVIDRNATSAEIEEYSQQMLVTVGWIKRQVAAGKTLSASFKGIPIEVSGRKWGVLILDSRDPNGALQANFDMSQHAFVLGKLLERTS